MTWFCATSAAPPSPSNSGRERTCGGEIYKVSRPDLGLLGVTVPEAYGGAEAGYVSYGLVKGLSAPKFLGALRWALTILFDAKPSAEHRRLFGAAEGGKGIGGDAGGVLGPRVVRTGNGLMCRKRGLCDGQSLGGAPPIEKEARIMTCVSLRQRVVAAERLFADSSRPAG